METNDSRLLAAIGPLFSERSILLSQQYVEKLAARAQLMRRAFDDGDDPVDSPQASVPTPPQGVAVLPMIGVLTKYPTWCDGFMGFCPTLPLMQSLDNAVHDPAVSTIVLLIDSPGGYVDGSVALADAVAAANKEKPVVAMVNGLCCSGAYWVASQAGRIVARRENECGNIGVFSVLADRSEMLKSMGISLTTIASGQFKGLGFDGKVTDDYIADTKRINDGLFNQFVAAVAAGRKLDPDRARELSDGRAYLGPQAKQLGLIDEVTADVAGAIGALVTGAAAPQSQEPNMAQQQQTATAPGAAQTPAPVVNITPHKAGDDDTGNDNARKVLDATIESAKGHRAQVRTAMDHASDMDGDPDDDTKSKAKTAVAALKATSAEAQRCAKAWLSKIGEADNTPDDDDDEEESKSAASYVAAFGDVGARWYTEGKPFRTAAAEYIAKLNADHKAETDRLKAANAELEKRLAAMPRGNEPALASAPEEAKPGPAAKKQLNGLSPGLSRFAAGLKFAGQTAATK